MLAERKRKTKWIINPTKKPIWTSDSAGIKLGKQLMEKMGWSAGKGLGAKEQGIQEPLRVSYKNDTKGMGFKGNDDNWIEYQDEFNTLLSQLSSNIDSSDKPNKNEIKSLEEKSRKSRARVHYQKFTRGKDLSRYSENDLACILGSSKSKEKIRNEKEEKRISQDESSENTYETTFGVTTINSGSIQDYFKKKSILDKLKKNNSTEVSNELCENEKGNDCINSDYEKEVNECKKIKKKDKNFENEEHKNIEDDGIGEESSRVKEVKINKEKRTGKYESDDEPKRKKRKTEKCNANDDVIKNVETTSQCENEEGNDKVETLVTDNCDETSDGNPLNRRSKKKKKSKESEENLNEKQEKKNKKKQKRAVEEITNIAREVNDSAETNSVDIKLSKREKNKEADVNEKMNLKEESVKEKKKKKKKEKAEEVKTDTDELEENKKDRSSLGNKNTNEILHRDRSKKWETDEVSENSKKSSVVENSENKIECDNIGKAGMGRNGVVHSHKAELFKKKMKLAFLPKNYSNERVLNLICGAEIEKFRGSNLGTLSGYGMKKTA